MCIWINIFRYAMKNWQVRACGAKAHGNDNIIVITETLLIRAIFKKSFTGFINDGL